jgi:hypothetical protein
LCRCPYNKHLRHLAVISNRDKRLSASVPAVCTNTSHSPAAHYSRKKAPPFRLILKRSALKLFSYNFPRINTAWRLPGCGYPPSEDAALLHRCPSCC